MSKRKPTHPLNKPVSLYVTLPFMFLSAICIYFAWKSAWYCQRYKEAVRGQSPADTAYNLGFRNGWMAYAIDDGAVTMYHMNLDFKDDTNPAVRSNAWFDAVTQAAQNEKVWNRLTDADKLALPFTPFWKSNKGEPRRILKGDSIGHGEMK